MLKSNISGPAQDRIFGKFSEWKQRRKNHKFIEIIMVRRFESHLQQNQNSLSTPVTLKYRWKSRRKLLDRM